VTLCVASSRKENCLFKNGSSYANRGEIAVRIIRACASWESNGCSVFRGRSRALHVREADALYLVGRRPAAESISMTAKILEAAERTGADAVHPGYGLFL